MAKKQNRVRVSIYIPPAAMAALKRACIDHDISVSSLVAKEIEQRFQPGRRDPLPHLKPENGDYASWTRATVFVDPATLKRAKAEVARLNTGTFSSAVSGLVSAVYVPEQK